jgi:hypothetical protein
MSVEQYQRIVNSLDKEIVDLEKKKASYDKKSSDARKNASRVNISKNASQSTIKSKLRQMEQYETNARKAETESASLSRKIADKRKKRNDAYLKLQKETQNEQKKQEKKQEKMLSDIRSNYEQRISELQNQFMPVFRSTIVDSTQTSTELSSEEYDVFVSHAWEDKESFVDVFVQALQNRDIRVWYDTTQIKWGDSMRERIDDGLRKSKFGVVVLSPNYIADGKYWTKAELDGLFQLESINGKTLLPIWHELTKHDC